MNPRAATNDLLPFQGSPFGQLGYFSKKNDRRLIYMICSDLSSPFFQVYKMHPRGAFLYIRKEHFPNIQKNRISICRYDSSGEGGIRTHAPLRTNGFQDRLVMTTSIPLHILFCRFLFMSFATSSILSHGLYYVNTFSKLF